MNMKQLLSLFFLLSLFSCKNSPTNNKFQNKINEYAKTKIKNFSSYKIIHSTNVDTTDYSLWEDSNLQAYKPDYKYSLSQVYEVENSEKEKIDMTVTFQFDSLLNIIHTYPEGLNGDYGEVTGNVYWKYNNYVGNKPDAGSKIWLYSIDTLRNKQIYDATCDVMGNFKLDKILSGFYLMIVKSENTTSSPSETLENLLRYDSYVAKVFGYDIYKENIAEIKYYNGIDSLKSQLISSKDKSVKEIIAEAAKLQMYDQRK